MARQRFYTNWDDVPVILDLPAAAILLGLSVSTLKRLAASGQLGAFKIGKSWRLSKEAVAEFMRKG